LNEPREAGADDRVGFADDAGRVRFRQWCRVCRRQRGTQIYAPLPANELDALVAPIALYPDALLAQVLGAATYPDQVVAASSVNRRSR
jgi:Protein of unknown function (DUF3300)